MPADQASLLIVLSAAAPGWVFVQTMKRRMWRADRTATEEVIEFISAGSVATVISALVVALFIAVADSAARAIGLGGVVPNLNPASLQGRTFEYLLSNRGTAAFLLFLIVVLVGFAVLIAWIGARYYPIGDAPSRFIPDSDGVYYAIGRWLGRKHVWITAEMSDSGDVYRGFVKYAPAYDEEQRYLVMQGAKDRQRRVVDGAGKVFYIEDDLTDSADTVVLPIDEIRVMTVKYVSK